MSFIRYYKKFKNLVEGVSRNLNFSVSEMSKWATKGEKRGYNKNEEPKDLKPMWKVSYIDILYNILLQNEKI